MFQACVSISVCIFYVFMNIYTGYVCINGHTAGKKKNNNNKKILTYMYLHVPYFSVARYANTTIGGGGGAAPKLIQAKMPKWHGLVIFIMHYVNKQLFGLVT